MEIQYLSPVWSRLLTLEDLPMLSDFLYFTKEIYKKSFNSGRKIRSVNRYPLVNDKGIFLSGFIPRIHKFCENSNLPFRLVGDYNEIISPWAQHPKMVDKVIQKFKLKEYQVEAFMNAILPLRGVVHYPTGSGKTEIFLAITDILIQTHQDLRALILVRTQDLLIQNYERAIKISEKEPIGIIGKGEFQPQTITIATAQTLAQFIDDFESETGKIGIIIIDECDLGMSFVSQYSKILRKIKAPVRLGFSATLPTRSDAIMAMEGYLGPILASKKVVEIPDLAKPKIKLVKIPYSSDVREQKRYSDVYDLGIVHNRRRNKIVLEEVQKLVRDGRTVLIFITKLQHGYNLLRMADNFFPELKIAFVQGETGLEVRNRVKQLLERGQTQAVISSTIWERGIDIPSLGAIVNAAGGKSEIRTIQMVGRGLRKPSGKEDVIVIDFFDPSHYYLISHFGERITLYFDEGWISS